MKYKSPHDEAKAYSQEKHRLAILNMIFSPAVLIVFIYLGIPVYLSHIARLFSINQYLNLFVFYILFGAVYYVSLLPLQYYSGFVIEHKYSLSNQTLKAWLKRKLKEAFVSSIIALPFIYAVYVFMRYMPLHWWLLTAILSFVLSVLIAKFAPLLLVPLFYKYSPIKNKGLKERLLKLSLEAGFRAEGVYEIDFSKETKKANAALIGLGKQKRIVLCDTLLKAFTDDEIVSVMGHELGHHRLRHILKLTVTGGLSTLLVFFVTNFVFLYMHNKLGYNLLYDFQSLVLIYAIISALNITLLPLHNAYSRKLEKDADLSALKITGNKDAFISTMKKLARQNLADEKPGKFYEIMLYSHPPISRRVAFAESYGKSIS